MAGQPVNFVTILGKTRDIRNSGISSVYPYMYLISDTVLRASAMVPAFFLRNGKVRAIAIRSNPKPAIRAPTAEVVAGPKTSYIMPIGIPNAWISVVCGDKKNNNIIFNL